MKSIDIALKDLTRSFRSMFALIFMFGIPLLMGGMFYFMFGSTANDDEGFSLPRTKVVIANLDQGSEQIQAGLAQSSQELPAGTLGDTVVQILQNEEFAKLLDISTAPDAAAARQIVDTQQAGVAIIIPENFSASFADAGQIAEVELYQDPTLTIGPRIVRAMLSSFMDRLASSKITIGLALQQPGGYAKIDQIMQDLFGNTSTETSSQEQDATGGLLEVSFPTKSDQPASFIGQIVGPIMGGMLVFYAFFTGASTGQSILHEDEEGTLPRLFTTPTPQRTILTGKFLAVGLTVIVQVLVLIIVSQLLFGIQWGAVLAVSLTVVGIMAISATFGIFINAFTKSTKQSGVLFGGFLTVTGMLGMMSVFTGSAPNTSSALDIASLFVPQGWAVRGLQLTMSNASLSDVIVNLLALLAWSVVFFVVGVWRFQKRYA